MLNYSSRKISFLILISVLAAFTQAALYITEIHYHPLEATVTGQSVDGDLFEFIEIKNTGTEAVDLTGYSFTAGVTYTFPAGKQIAAGGFVVLASDQTWFQSRYGFAADGQYTGNLTNSGESVTLSDASGVKVDNVTYKDASPWPIEADGSGNSLVSIKTDRSGDPDLFSTWRASSSINGSPKSDDPETTSPKVLVNEIMSNPKLPQTDYIELYNSEAIDADISGWFLSDNNKAPKKFKIPASTIMPAHSYKLFTADDFNATSDSTSFQLSNHGEEVFLSAANAEGNLTGYSNGVTFDEIETNISFGRYVTSTGETHFVAQSSSTPGAANSDPLIGKVVITEIMYSGTDGVEYLELQNNSNETVALYDTANPINTWKVSGIGFDFPSNVKINAGQIILLIDDTITVDAFRSKFSLPNDIQLFTYGSTLQGNGETIKLLKPEDPFTDDSGVTVPYMLIDEVSYDNSAPWPADADGSGKSLHRIRANAYGNDPANWKSAQPSPGSPTAIIHRNNQSQSHDVKVSISANFVKNAYSVSIFMPKSEKVCFDLFDCNGRLHARLINKQLQAGQNIEEISSSGIDSNNLLFLRIKTSDRILYTGKLLVSN